jgi:VanZ family protein
VLGRGWGRGHAFRWLPLLLWMALIFTLSATPNPYAALPSAVEHDGQVSAAPLGIAKTIDNELLGRISHAGIFAVLAILAYRAVRPAAHPMLLAFVLSAAYALSDEVHQLFVPGRAFELRDLALDTLGILLGLVIVFLAQRFKPGTSASSPLPVAGRGRGRGPVPGRGRGRGLP